MRQRYLQEKAETHNTARRFWFLVFVLAVVGFIFVLRLAKFQILDKSMYQVLASDQYDLESKLLPSRGRILIKDPMDGKLYPLAANRDSWQVFAEPKNISDPVVTAHELSGVLGIPDVDLIAKLADKPDDPYEPITRDVETAVVEELRSKNLEGIGYARSIARLYPEKNMGGQVVGVVTQNDQGALEGRYGVEYTFDEQLAGHPGSFSVETDRAGRRIIFGQSKLIEATDGDDVILTLDRSIQFQACERIRQGVLNYQADNGTMIVMDSDTGAILAMCSFPDFDPSNLKEVEDVGIFNNPATFVAYEPGSVFKAITMAGGLNEDKVNPNTTYEDKGFLEIDDFTIKNSDGKVHGIKTMTEVLDESLNTGSIFVMRQLGKKVFQDYVKEFGFGESTGIELRPESSGDISSLENKGEIFAATASYGQGITVTPVQLIAAFGALANYGKLMRPYIVSEIIHADGTREVTEPKIVREVITQRSAQLITRMLTSVVEGTHGELAQVPGYWVAGKTGTAQVAKRGSRGYEANKFITTFIGYAPADEPEFVMLVKLENPKTTMWAASSAAPIFGDMAKYLLNYLNIKPTR
ncbi:MAG: penicillin-binding protein 2 [Patescibacteria group bacterium]|nr:penicillin-binding protein 2 [Patescibacteria group bacterium]